jgi:RHS repeat-associated protein
MRLYRFPWTLVCIVAMSLAQSSPAFAQAQNHLPPRAEGSSPTGVNYKSGAFTMNGMVDLSIGGENLAGLQLVRSYSSSNDSSLAALTGAQGWTFSTQASIVRNKYVYPPDQDPPPNPNNIPWVYTVMTGTDTNRFMGGPTTFTGVSQDGQTLALVGGNYVLTDSLGTIYIYPNVGVYPLKLQSITYPDGTALTYSYSPKWMVISNRGYALLWESVNKVCAINMAETFVSSAMSTCPAGAQTVTYAYTGSPQNMTASTDAAGFTRSYSYVGANHLGCVKDPGQSTCRITNTYNVCPQPSPTVPANRMRDQVTSQTTATGEFYSYSIGLVGTSDFCYGYAGYGSGAVVTAPSGTTSTIYTNGAGSVTGVVDALGRVSGYTFDDQGLDPYDSILPIGHSKQEGNGGYVVRDSRGNITERWITPKPGSGLGNVKISSANFPVTCANHKTCNRPTWIRDSKGNQTDYTYDANHGGILTETKSADVNGIRPQKRFGYTQIYAWVKNSSGAYVQATTPVWMLTSTSECRTLASCAGGADEFKKIIGYGTAGTANNLLPTSITLASGNGSISVTTTRTYDFSGNTLTIDGPIAGSADMTRYRYDGLRHVIGKIDPAGSSGKHRATRYTFDGSSNLAKIERGTVNSQSDVDWSAFASLQSLEYYYDLMGRLIRETQSGNGAIAAFTQYSFDAAGRADCKAIRMDPSQWASQSNACVAQTTGAYGPDRVTRNVYNVASEITQFRVAVGTTDEAAQVTNTYTPNGNSKTVIDGENNLTTYSRDAYDRLVKTNYPDPTVKGSSSSSIYEQTAYDFNGNVTQRRLRDGQLINFSFDNLDRITLKDLPAPESDAQYSLYDLQGNLKRVVQGTSTVEMSWDALGRNISSTSDTGTMLFQVDELGRRTRITWPDGFYVTQDYLPTGELSAIREYGATSGVGVLAIYTYDDLGERASIARGNGTSTSFGLDVMSRLLSLNQNLAGTSADVTWSYSYNPASQLATAARDNDSYAWNGHYNSNLTYALNGLNQVTGAGATSYAYDSRGNMTVAGANLYGYSAENRMIAGPGGATLIYDATGRLSATSKSGDTTRFQYDGVDLVAEYNASNVLVRRYVHGPAVDEPLVWYEGTGTSDRRWYHQDERKSVIALSSSSGALIAANRYDEFGNASPSNLGRFSYTGQTWIQEIAAYYFKARMYSSALGRFMQTDPRGTQEGPNIYWYANGDPINGSDPSGEVTIITFGPNEASAIKLYSTIRFDGGIFVAGHSAPGRMVDDRPNAMTHPETGYVYRDLAPRSLLAMITRDAGSSVSGKPIILAGCQIGKESFAIELAQLNKSWVIAPRGYIQPFFSGARGDPSQKNGTVNFEQREFKDEANNVLSGPVKSWVVIGPNGQELGEFKYLHISKKTGELIFSNDVNTAQTRITPHVVCDDKGCEQK